MNLIQVAVLILASCVGVLVLVVALHIHKKSQITHGVSIMSTTSADERATFNVNFLAGDSAEQKYEKLNQICGLADRRREESFARLQKRIEEEEQKQEQAKLKPVS